MKETRFFYVPDAATETEMPMDEALHALRVLRIKSGDEMFLMDGVGNFYRAEVTLAATKRCMYEVKEVMPQQPAWRGHVHFGHCSYQDDGPYRVDGREGYRGGLQRALLPEQPVLRAQGDADCKA